MSRTSMTSVLAAACAGAALMYFLDPELGEDRRKTVSKKVSDMSGSFELPDVGDRYESAKSYLKSMLPSRSRFEDLAEYLPRRRDVMSRAQKLRKQGMRRLGFEEEESSGLKTLGIVTGVLAGCALAGVGVYFLLGEERKRQIKESATSMYESGMDRAKSMYQSGRESMSGLTDKAKQMMGKAEDRKLADKVHFELNRLPFELRGLHVRSESGGKVHLYCDCPAEHYDEIIEAARKVPGVKQVISHMQATAGA